MASVALAAPSPVSVGSAPGYSGNPGGSASQIVPQSVMVCRTAGDGGGDDCADAAEVGVLTLASWVAPGDDTLGDGTGVDERPSFRNPRRTARLRRPRTGGSDVGRAGPDAC